jgi:hypothetical protein
MDIKLIDYETRIPNEYRLSVFAYVLKHISDPEQKYEYLHGKAVSIFSLQYFKEHDPKTLLFTVQVSVVKNKTCYTVYCHLMKTKP